MSTIDADEFLNNLEKASKELDGEHQVSFDDLFTTSFMNKHTNFSTFEKFLNGGNFVVNSEEDFDSIPDADMDNHVRKSTSFSSWEEMLTTSSEEYTLKKLGF